MLKSKKNLIMIVIMLLLVLPTVSNGTFIRDKDSKNVYIGLPSTIKPSWMTNWDGYYTWSGTLKEQISLEGKELKVQIAGIPNACVDDIQDKSDEITDDDEFYSWLDSYISSYVNASNWENLNSMSFDLECKLCNGTTSGHQHLVFVKMNGAGTENIIWQGYGDGFNRILQSRQAPKLVGIEISEEPNKTIYLTGETFDPEAMIVKAFYSDDSSKVITDYTFSPDGPLTVEDNQITISYTEGQITKTTTLEIQVIENFDETKELDYIKVSKMPTKVDYAIGDKFESKGMKITAYYTDGTSKDVTANAKYSPTGNLTKDDTVVTIKYTENNVTKTAKLAINVVEKLNEDKPKEEKAKDNSVAPNGLPYTGGTFAIIAGGMLAIIAGAYIYKRKNDFKGI